MDTAAGNKKTKLKIVLLAAVVTIAIGIAGYKLYGRVETGITATGTIEVTKTDVTPKVAGYLAELKIKEGDRERIQEFKGVVLYVRGNGNDATFTVRRVASNGIGVERTFPGYGKVQQERIMRALGSARTGQNFALESLGYLPTRFFPTGSQIVMVSPLLAGDVAAFTQLRACGYEVLVVSPNTMSEVSSSVLMSMKSLASRVARRPSAFRPVMVVGKVPSQSLRDR